MTAPTTLPEATLQIAVLTEMLDKLTNILFEDDSRAADHRWDGIEEKAKGLVTDRLIRAKASGRLTIETMRPTGPRAGVDWRSQEGSPWMISTKVPR